MNKKIRNQAKPDRIWRVIDIKDPMLQSVKFDLLILRDVFGDTQVGWFTGTVFEFYRQKIDRPIEWKRPAERCHTGHSKE